MNRRRRAAGFTLLEAMIAISIFSFIGAGAYQLLSSTGSLQERGAARYAALAGFQLAIRLLDDDLSQVQARPLGVTPDADAPPSLTSSPEQGAFEFTRNGWRNPLGEPRSRLQRVAWELDDDGNLLRRYWRDAAHESGDDGVARVLLGDIEELEVRYLDGTGKWSDAWPPDAGGALPEGARRPLREPLPDAVEVTVHHRVLGEVKRVVPLR